MIRKIGMAAVVAGLAFGGVAAIAGPASAAAKPTITATGNASCSGVNGKVKFKPALSNINTQPTTTSGKLKAPTCTSSTEQGVKAKSGKATVLSQGTTPGTCDGLTEPGSTPFNVSIAWKADGGKINPSNIVFPNVQPAGAGFALNNGDVSGSYAGNDTASAQANIDIGPVATALTTPGGCNPNDKGKAKGIKKITVTSGTITLN